MQAAIGYVCIILCSPCNTKVATTSAFENLFNRKLDWNRDLRIGFGDSAEVISKETNNDVTVPRSKSCIAVMPTGSARGDVTFFCPYTGGYTTQSNFIIVPTNEAMIQHLTEMWRNDGSRPCRDPTITRGIQRIPVADLPDEPLVYQHPTSRLSVAVDPSAPLLLPDLSNSSLSVQPVAD